MTDYQKIVKWNKETTYGEESLFVTKLVKKGLTYAQIVTVLEAIDSTCHHCWDSDSGCQCWNDE